MSVKSIDVECGNCKKISRLDPAFVSKNQGKAFKCGKCGNLVMVPSATEGIKISSQANTSEAKSNGTSEPNTAEREGPDNFSISVEPEETSVHKKSLKKSKNNNQLLFIVTPIALLIVIFVVIYALSPPDDQGAQAKNKNNSNQEKKSSKKALADSKPGVLQLKWPVTSRLDARLYIDGKENEIWEVGDIKYELPAGKHTLKIRRNDSDWATHEFVLVAGKTHTFETPDIGINRSNVAKRDLTTLYDNWEQSIPKAVVKAKAEKKELFLLFNGSDWCPYSEAAAKTIFSRNEFYELFGEEYVFVHIDFPQGKAKSKVEDQDRNALLAAEFGVQNYPTMLLADSDGRPFQEIALDDGTFNSFESNMFTAQNSLKERNRLFEIIKSRLENRQPIEIEPIVKAFPPNFIGAYADVFESWRSIAASKDPKNRFGLNEKMFLLWWGAKMKSRRAAGDPDQLKQLEAELKAWLEQCSFSDPSDGGRCYFQLAVLTRLFDLKDSMRIARLGLEFKSDDQDIRAALYSLSSDIASWGSGFAINDNGLILTNAHVVGFANEVDVQVNADAILELKAEVIGVDVDSDLALLQISDLKGKNIPGLTFFSAKPGTGAAVAALGFPGFAGGEQATQEVQITTGVISSFNDPQNKGFIVTDSDVNPGNSGGPMLTQNGMVVGVITRKTLRDLTHESFGLAIPVHKLKSFLETHVESQISAVRFVDEKLPELDSWESVVSQNERSIVRIAIRRKNIPIEKAEEMDAQVWKVVKSAGQSADDYDRARRTAADYCQTWPNGNYLNTMGVAQYRCKMYASAVKTLERASKANTSRFGAPSPVDLAFLAMSYFQKGDKRTARTIRQQFERLMDNDTNKQNADLLSFQKELNDLMGG